MVTSATSPNILPKRKMHPKSLANLKPPWKPGTQPNPHPVGDYSVTNRLKRKLALRDGASVDEIAETMIRTACAPNSRGYATALIQLLDRTEGKVTERIEANVTLSWAELIRRAELPDGNDGAANP